MACFTMHTELVQAMCMLWCRFCVSNYRQALISNYHDLVQLRTILKKDPIHKQIVATAKRLRSEEDYDLAESYAWALKKRKFLIERILDNYEMPKLSTTEELPGTSNAK